MLASGPRALSLAVTAACSLAAPTGSQAALGLQAQASNLLLIDPSGEAGPFPDVASALAVARDGDVLVVQADGDYDGFTVDGLAVAIVAADGIRPRIGPKVTVRDLEPGETFVLRGFELWRQAPGLAADNPNLDVYANRGTVWIEDCVVHTRVPVIAWAGPTLPALRIEGVPGAAGEVVVARSSIQSPGGASHPLMGHSQATDGIWAIDARLSLWDTIVTAGPGYPGESLLAEPAGPGADAVVLQGGTLLASACRLVGGRGGQGDLQFGCTDAGSGGAGLLVDGGAHATLLATELVQGGPGLAQSTCADGSPGVPALTLDGTIASSTAGGFGLSTDATVASGSSARIEVACAATGPFVVLAGDRPATGRTGVGHGRRHVALRGVVASGQGAPATSTFVTATTPPMLRQDGAAVLAFVQAVHLAPIHDRGRRVPYYGAPSAVVLLDPAHD